MQTPVIDFDDFVQWTTDDNVTNQLSLHHSNQISPKFNICCYEDKFLDELNKFRLEDMYTDVKLMCQGREYSAHRMILASGCEFFHEIFTQKKPKQQLQLQKKGNIKVVEIKDIEPSVLELIISYLYTGKLNFSTMTHQTFKRFMRAVSQLKVTAVQKIFLNYMINHISPMNFNYVLHTAVSLKDTKAEEDTVKYLIKNIETVWLQPDFSKLSDDHLARIFKSISKSLQSHDLLLLILFMLLDSNPTRTTICNLHPFIDFKKVSLPWAKDLFRDGNGNFDPTCKSACKIYNNPAVIKEILKAAVFEYKRKNKGDTHNHIMSGSVFSSNALENIAKHEVILIFVGLDRANRAVCTNYRFVKGTWSKVEDTGFTTENNPGIGLYDDKIFFIGGEDGIGNKLTTACYYDMESKKLGQLPNIAVARSLPVVSYFKNNILVAGGLGRYGLTGITVVEKLNLAHEKNWSIGQPLRIKRGKKSHGLVVNGKTVITGGGSLQCEVFNWKTRVWSKSEPLPVSDDELFVHAGADDKLYAFRDYKPELIYELDFKTGRWSSFRVHGSLPESILAVAGWKSYIFAVDRSRIIYVLNIEMRNWNKNCKLPADMVRAIYVGISKYSR